jgi:hypothetical protein
MKCIVLKRLLLLAAMAAMVLALALPALANGTNTGNAQNTVGQESEQESDSGDVDQSFESSSTGDNSNVCLAPSFVTNTGNAQNTVGQESEQESDSGDVDQSFESSSTGDNSNVCLAPSFVANTGNAQNQIDLLQYGSGAGGFEFDEVSSDIAVGGTNETTCDQQVNQAASASGGG